MKDMPCNPTRHVDTVDKYGLMSFDGFNHFHSGYLYFIYALFYKDSKQP